MRHPRRWRNISLWCATAGALSLLGAFLLPAFAAGDGARGVMGMFGLTALLFGAGNAVFRHLDARAKDALARGEEILARWRVDADTWQAFVAYNRQLDQEDGVLPNELIVRDPAPAHGVDVIAAEQAVQVGESIHRLPRRGTPEVTHAVLNKGRVRPSFVELLLYYPGGGQGASGLPMRSLRTALRFPVPLGAIADAERVVARYAAGRPGKADFFHGVGDGRDSEDLSTCWMCGYQTHRFASHCPRCGAGLQSRRWSRRFGAALVVCGFVIAAIMAVVLYSTVPTMLRPGVDIGGTRFSGSRAQAMVALGIMAAVFVFGVTTMLYGAWQVRSGARSVRVVAFLLGIVGLLWLVSLML